MWGLRKQVSLLLDHGHKDARHYPVGMVWDESEIVVERVNRELASQATIMQAAFIGSNSKKGAAHLQRLLKELTDG